MDVLWNQTAEARWRALTRRHGCALQQDWHYGEAVAALGGAILRAEIRHDGRTIGLAQFSARRAFGRLRGILCARGPVWAGALDAATRGEALMALRRSAPLSYPALVLISPEDAEGDAPQAAALRRVATGYATAQCDLTQPVAAMRSAMRQKWRNRLRTAEASGEQDRYIAPKEDLLETLASRESLQRQKRRYRGISPRFAAAFRAVGGTVSAALRGPESDPTAAMVFLHHGRNTTYHLGWADEIARRRSAHAALLWRGMQRLKAQGIETLDLGGISTTANPGLARFKLGSGARPLILCGTYI